MAEILVCHLSSYRKTYNMGKQGLTLALAFLQFVHALGVTESGTFLFLPADVPGLCSLDGCSEVSGSVEVVGFREDDWTSCMDWPELLVAVVSERVVSDSAINCCCKLDTELKGTVNS